MPYQAPNRGELRELGEKRCKYRRSSTRSLTSGFWAAPLFSSMVAVSTALLRGLLLQFCRQTLDLSCALSGPTPPLVQPPEAFGLPMPYGEQLLASSL